MTVVSQKRSLSCVVAWWSCLLGVVAVVVRATVAVFPSAPALQVVAMGFVAGCCSFVLICCRTAVAPDMLGLDSLAAQRLRIVLDSNFAVDCSLMGLTIRIRLVIVADLEAEFVAVRTGRLKTSVVGMTNGKRCQMVCGVAVAAAVVVVVRNVELEIDMAVAAQQVAGRSKVQAVVVGLCPDMAVLAIVENRQKATKVKKDPGIWVQSRRQTWLWF